MPQDRRSPPSATQDTNQPPIVQPHSATLSPSAFLVGVLRSQQFPAVSAPESDHGRGNPAHVRPPSRPERQNQDAAGRSSPPRSGIHTAASSGRGSAAVLLAPCSAPTATWAVARERSSPRRARTLPPFSIPWRQPKPTPPPSIDDQGGGLFIRARQQPIRLAVGPIPPTSGRLAVRPGRRQPTPPSYRPPQLADHHHHRGRGSPPTPAVHPQRCSRAMGQRPT